MNSILFNELTFLCRIYNTQSTASWVGHVKKNEKLVIKTRNSLAFINSIFCVYLDTLQQI